MFRACSLIEAGDELNFSWRTGFSPQCLVCSPDSRTEIEEWFLDVRTLQDSKESRRKQKNDGLNA
eukprot:5418518-Amphidinium_carterae.1